MKHNKRIQKYFWNPEEKNPRNQNCWENVYSFVLQNSSKIERDVTKNVFQLFDIIW